MTTHAKRKAVILAAALAILFLMALRLVQLLHQMESCVPTNDQIIEMWRRS